MEKMQAISQRENIEKKIKALENKLKEIRESCDHEIIIMYKCSNYFWVDARCLFCNKKIDEMYVLKKKEDNVINADFTYLLSNENKYKIVKEKYERISTIHLDWSDSQIVLEINKELNQEQE